MSWKNIVKGRTSRSAKLVWPSMKKLIDNFFETDQEYTVLNLTNYLVNNLDNQLREDRPDISDMLNNVPLDKLSSIENNLP